MCSAVLPSLLLLPLVSTARASPSPPPFNGTYLTGTGDAAWLSLLDVARRQLGTDIELPSLLALYYGDWDGFLEGPTETGPWKAYWTQNSYGTAMGALPFLPPTAWHAISHSHAWWFNSMANGSTYSHMDPTTTSSSNGPVPAPDGMLCDAATPCAGNNCCAYKQGDGAVTLHDWTFEESLSALVMEGERVLIGRNVSAAPHYLAMALRTSELLETRRDQATGYATFLTGPSSNLLAPSGGGATIGTNAFGGWTALSGVLVTYTAAIDKMIACAELLLLTETSPRETNTETMQWRDMVKVLTRRRELNMAGLLKLMLVKDAARNATYLARSRDPTGLRHGVLGQQLHGYFEVSPNVDAVAHGLFNASLSEALMATIDAVDSGAIATPGRVPNVSAAPPVLRPHTLLIPNSDAGGGIGYDDMLRGESAGIYTYGTWVNGGVWATVEGRAMIAYMRTQRHDLAKASMAHNLAKWIATWKMDAPLTHFGANTWFSKPVLLTIDAFGPGAGLLRGLVGLAYEAATLTLTPQLPDDVTSLAQHYSARWGAYRIALTFDGICSSGIASVTLNGVPLKPPHGVNATAVVLNYAAMPVPSAAAAASVISDLTTASDAVVLSIAFKTSSAAAASAASAAQKKAARRSAAPLPPNAVLWFDANTLLASHTAGDSVSSWSNGASPGGAASTSSPFCACDGNPKLPPSAPTFTAEALPSVDFNGATSCLCGSEATTGATGGSTIVAVFRDNFTAANFAPLWHSSDGSYAGLTVSVSDCANGEPNVPGVPCTDANRRVVNTDWSGSTSHGFTNVSRSTVVASTVYGATTTTLDVLGCAQGGATGPPLTPRANESAATAYIIGARNDSHHRLWRGALHELIIFDRALGANELAVLEEALAVKWGAKWRPRNCGATPPTLDCAAMRTAATAAGAALSATMLASLSAFLAAAAAATPSLSATLPCDMARDALSFNAAFDARCAGLMNGSVPALRDPASTNVSLTLTLATARELANGCANYVAERNRTWGTSDPTTMALVKLWTASGGQVWPPPPPPAFAETREEPERVLTAMMRQRYAR